MALNLAQLIPTQNNQPSPSEVERRRRLAQQLAGGGVDNAGPLGALSKALAGTVSGYEDRQASEMETAGQAAASEALARALSDPNAGLDVLAQAATNPFTTDRQGAIASALIGQKMERSDPAYQLDLDLKRAQLAKAQSPASADPTSAIQNYEYLVSSGVDPAKAQAMSFGGGGVNVNNMGNIPAGYEIVNDPATGATRMQPIPGGPADQEAAAAADKASVGAGQRDVATQTITRAADLARQALNSGGVTAGVGGAIAGMLPESQAAELRRQVGVLTSNATIENLNSMRQSSPTGGALGNVTEGEGRMLAAKSGAIDPNSSPAQLAAAIDDYERTLLQIVHGPQEGDRIYQETRKQGQQGGGVVDWTSINWGGGQ